MSTTSIRRKVLLGVLWNSIEKIGMQGGQFIIGIVLARILTPRDFGAISMLTIFIVISNLLFESGLNKALIQKDNKSVADFSTVFIFNVLCGVLLYVILFFGSTLVADFYNFPELRSVSRILCLTIIFNSVTNIHIVYYTNRVDFKFIAKVNLISTLISGLVAIGFAFGGFGVWSLVALHVTRSFVNLVFFGIFSKLKLNIKFSKKSFSELYQFGYRLVLAGIYSKVLEHTYDVVIGKVYSAINLGYYSRAKSFTEFTSGTLSNIIQQVSFPVLASIKGEKERMINFYKNTIQMTAFINFPALTLLSILADPIVRILLTEKWLFTIPLLQWIAFTRFFYPICAINLNILNVIGRSDLFLKVDLIKFPITVIPMVISFFISVKAMVIAQVIVGVLSFFVNAYLPGKFYSYGALKQLKDLGAIIISTFCMGIVVFTLTALVDNSIYKLIIGFFSAICSYLIFIYIFNARVVTNLYNFLMSKTN